MTLKLFNGLHSVRKTGERPVAYTPVSVIYLAINMGFISLPIAASNGLLLRYTDKPTRSEPPATVGVPIEARPETGETGLT